MLKEAPDWCSLSLFSFQCTPSFFYDLIRSHCKRIPPKKNYYSCDRISTSFSTNEQFRICRRCLIPLKDCLLLSLHMIFRLFSSLELHHMIIFLTCFRKPQIHQNSIHFMHLVVECPLDRLLFSLMQLPILWILLKRILSKLRGMIMVLSLCS